MHAGLLMGMVLLLLRRFEPPIGSLTFLVGVTAVFVTMIKGADPVILVGVLGGMAADVMPAAMRPSPERLVQLRVFAFLLPLVVYALYFAALISVDGVWWPMHLWAGAPIVAGLTGWLVSLPVVPPAMRPAEAA